MMAQTQLEYIARLSQKRRATATELAMYRPISFGRYEIEVDGRIFRLDREDEKDNLDALEKNEAHNVNPLWNRATNSPDLDAASLPDAVDHRPDQTPIKDQEDRGTCVCFASLANLEAIIKKNTGNTLDLSEQYANWLYMKNESRNQCDDGLRTTLAARYLSQNGVCLENLNPYEDRTTVHTHCDAMPPATAQQNAIYGIGQYVLIDRLGLLGPSIANADYLENLLHAGYDIVFGTHVAWGLADANNVFDIILDIYGNPQASRGGHAMLIVGYDRKPTTPIPYFIVKNSWGSNQQGVSGYYYLSYDYIRTYAKYGYIVQQVRTDMPTT
jgi:C1A family cysteine protease